jgi:hypothetical protein
MSCSQLAFSTTMRACRLLCSDHEENTIDEYHDKFINQPDTSDRFGLLLLAQN